MTSNQGISARTLSWVRWIALGSILELAAGLRFWAIGKPESLVFDEWYYVRDAISQLGHGLPTQWPEFEAHQFTQFATSYTEIAAPISHPPLGKWLIGLGVLMFGPESSFGWRASVAFSGTLTVAAVMLLGWRLTRNWVVGGIAGLMLAVDGVHVVLSRVSLLDGFLALFIVLGAVFVWEDVRSTAKRFGTAAPIVWNRPWLWAAAIMFGAATAVKWSGLFAVLGFAVFLTIVDVSRRVRSEQPRPLRGAVWQAFSAAVMTVPLVGATYVASWAGWIVSPSSPAHLSKKTWWVSLWEWHTDGLGWHSTLTAEHPYQAAPLTWPLGLRPTAMYLEQSDSGQGCAWEQGCATAITPLPNVFVTWAGVLALMLLLWVLLRAAFARLPRLAHWREVTADNYTPALSQSHTQLMQICGLVVAGYLSGWLPWVLLTSRSAVFQFYSVVMTPFAALALALVIGALVTSRTATPLSQLFPATGWPLSAHPEARNSRRLTIAVYLTVTLIISILFFPVWAGITTADWFWRAHLWLPGWS